MPKIPELVVAPDKAAPLRPERLAINICDCDRITPLIRKLLFGGQLDSAAGPQRTDPERPDEMAVMFSCDLLTAACVCDTARNHDRKAGDYPTRVYVKRAKAWTKVPAGTMLSVIVNGSTLALNPEVFPPVAVAAPAIPKAARRAI